MKSVNVDGKILPSDDGFDKISITDMINVAIIPNLKMNNTTSCFTYCSFLRRKIAIDATNNNEQYKIKSHIWIQHHKLYLNYMVSKCRSLQNEHECQKRKNRVFIFVALHTTTNSNDVMYPMTE